MKRIWVVGASVRAVAASVEQAGFHVVPCDLFGDRDLLNRDEFLPIQDFPHSVLTLIDHVRAKAWLYAGGLENYPDVVDHFASRLPLLGNSGAVLRRVRNVQLLQATLRASGFRMPEMTTSLPTDSSGWLRKSSRGAGGLSVVSATSDHMPSDAVYFQRFIAGDAFGASFMASSDGCELLGVSQQLLNAEWTCAPAFAYAGSLAPYPLSEERQAELVRLGRTLVEQFELRGWLGVDFIIDSSNQMWILEVNPRYTASMELLERAGNRSFALDHVRTCRGEPVSLSATVAREDRFVGKAILYAERDVFISAASSDAWTASSDLVDIPMSGQTIAQGRPILTVLASADKFEELRPRLELRIHEIRSMLRFPDQVAERIKS